MIIYKITNKKSGKAYIGQTTQTLKRRINGHINTKRQDSAIALAIKKYGIDSFDVEIIQKASSLEELNEIEQHYIQKFDTLYPKGYNLTTGGKNFRLSETTKKKLSIINTGKKQSKETVAKRVNKVTGRKNTKEVLARMSVAQRGNNATLTIEQVKKIKERLANAEKSINIAKDMNVSVWSVYKIKDGRTWKWYE